MEYVYILEAQGWDGLVGSNWRVIRTSTCFATQALAESRLVTFKEKILDAHMLDEGCRVSIVPLLIISI